ncbi:hypothetical protein KVT40_001022 [Elsinoe batatas]|uniref:Uncharacterized protein n=1 Tax=Elsinoe batatas TaxID=2601811 RepID=A0A8K0L9T3_9PEZI|nr:hypothetical protein KVT40_001022 [Elsinoe batatas]
MSAPKKPGAPPATFTAPPSPVAPGPRRVAISAFDVLAFFKRSIDRNICPCNSNVSYHFYHPITLPVPGGLTSCADLHGMLASQGKYCPPAAMCVFCKGVRPLKPKL